MNLPGINDYRTTALAMWRSERHKGICSCGWHDLNQVRAVVRMMRAGNNSYELLSTGQVFAINFVLSKGEFPWED